MASIDARHIENIAILNNIARKIKKGNHSSSEYQENLDFAYNYVKRQLPFYFTCDGKAPLPLYKPLFNALASVEKACKNSVFITEVKPNFDYFSSFDIKPSSSNNEQMLNYIISGVWQIFAHYYTQDQKLDDVSFVNRCGYFSSLISAICKEYAITCYELCINPGFLNTAELYGGTKYHKICVIELNGEYYLLDPSYRQFFLVRISSLKRVGIPFLDGATPAAFMLLDPRRKTLAESLLSQGFIKLDSIALKDYCDGFAMSFRNGLYYSMLQKNPYETNYTAENYADFLRGYDNQLNHEGRDILQRQRTIR